MSVGEGNSTTNLYEEKKKNAKKQRTIPRRKNFNSGENNDAMNLNGRRIIKLTADEAVRNMNKKSNPTRDTTFPDPFITMPLFFQKKERGAKSKKRIDNITSLNNCSVNSPIVIKNLMHRYRIKNIPLSTPLQRKNNRSFEAETMGEV